MWRGGVIWGVDGLSRLDSLYVITDQESARIGLETAL